VATALGLSPHTVKAHCQQLSKAVGTPSRARLCAIVVAAVWRESLRDDASGAAASA
jgi:DNA-binding CsgD family transcriptional regulator